MFGSLREANKTTTTREQQLLQAEQLLQQLLQLKVIEQKSRSRTLFKVIELNSEGQRTEDWKNEIDFLLDNVNLKTPTNYIPNSIQQVLIFSSCGAPLSSRIYAPPWETDYLPTRDLLRPMVYEMWMERVPNRDSMTGQTLRTITC